MARKKQAPEKTEDLADEAEGWEDAVIETEEKEEPAALRMRDWRDVERLRELKELRGMVDDDSGLEEIFRVQPPPPPAPKPARISAKTGPKGLAAAKPAAHAALPKAGKAKHPPKTAAHKTEPKAKAQPAAKVKKPSAKAKRR